jgi:hypothetical protein
MVRLDTDYSKGGSLSPVSTLLFLCLVVEDLCLRQALDCPSGSYIFQTLLQLGVLMRLH